MNEKNKIILVIYLIYKYLCNKNAKKETFIYF